MTLRTKLSLVLSALLALSIGLTGAIMIYESAQNTRAQLTVEQQLLAENRAFALRDNFEILESELQRLALLPQIDLGDDNQGPEVRLLENAHQNSVLYNTAVLLLSPNGTCVGSVPDRPEYGKQDYGDRPWFRAALTGNPGPFFRIGEDPVAGRALNIIQPIIRHHRFAGALVGVIALDQTNLISPAIMSNLPPETEAILVDQSGRIVSPASASRASLDPGWNPAIDRALAGAAGTLSGRVGKDDSLFAFAPVGAQTGFVVVFRRPWRVLVSHLRRQAWVLVGVVLFGIVIATAAGLALAAYLSQPLRVLGERAGSIARGEYDLLGKPELRERTDEVGMLVRAFSQMGAAIRQRDQELREAANFLEQRVVERTRELAAAQQALVDAERFAAVGKTSAAIAHELRNALNGLGMAVDLILEDPSNTARAGRLRKQVQSEIARLRDVVDSLLSFSRSPRVELRQENVAEVVHRAVAMLEEYAADREVQISVDLPHELKAPCDAHKVQGVVMNLIKNAVEAGRHVKVRAGSEGDAVIFIEVADDGPGFSEQARRHLFEPFFTTKPNGTGLGLPTSRRYVEAHGGTLEVLDDSEIGGAAVRVRLPMQTDGAATTPRSGPAAPLSAPRREPPPIAAALAAHEVKS